MDIAIVVLLNICAIKIQKNLFLWVLAFVLDAIVIVTILRRIRYEIYHDRAKQASCVLSFMTLLMFIVFIYPQYLDPECDAVSKEFLQCKLIKDGSVDFPTLQYMETYEIVIPKVQKKAFIESSNFIFEILDAITKMRNGDIEISETDVAELKALKSRYEHELTVLQQEAYWYQCQLRIVIIFTVIYKILWYWSGITHLYCCIRERGRMMQWNKMNLRRRNTYE